ncbi:hypothetical protein [Vibrio penaeicida]|uniref:Uncharacterized protein n=1 Tax=Vibrio penaeicida TaxID=104609 RepID=A0AAV5NLD7_9VIBR|nr:hypothetical protein [Vibrio penaeicida]RTZ23001.1 hypothetical protein EKN09_10995 [Vibrio penaeicida]GLQ71069.1 hypothetical protein GCM10007932_04290 [Vibrio penaeicida]
MDHTITVAIIKGLSIVTAAAVPSIITYIVSSKYFKKRDYRKLESQYLIALKDIEYLLEVERIHCRRNMEMLDQSHRHNSRKAVEIETQLSWSGKNSQKRVYLKRAKLEEKLNETKPS